MVKHRRFSDNPKPDLHEKKPENIVKKRSTTKPARDFKSILLSGTKYLYIIVAAALFSGIFTPLTIGADSENVIFGMLSLFLGLAGGIVIFLGIKTQKFTLMIISGGLIMIIISFFLMYEMIGKPLFG